MVHPPVMPPRLFSGKTPTTLAQGGSGNRAEECTLPGIAHFGSQFPASAHFSPFRKRRTASAEVPTARTACLSCISVQANFWHQYLSSFGSWGLTLSLA